MQRLAAYLGLNAEGPLTEAAAVRAIRDWTVKLRADIGVPHTIADLGVEPKRFDEIAALAVCDPTAGTNPVPLTEANVRGLLVDMHEGLLRNIG